MSRSRLSAFACVCIAACTSALAFIGAGISRAVEFVFAAVDARAIDSFFDFDDRLVAFAGDAPQIDPALANSLRHEAGMRPPT